MAIRNGLQNACNPTSEYMWNSICTRQSACTIDFTLTHVYQLLTTRITPIYLELWNCECVWVYFWISNTQFATTLLSDSNFGNRIQSNQFWWFPIVSIKRERSLGKIYGNCFDINFGLFIFPNFGCRLLLGKCFRILNAFASILYWMFLTLLLAIFAFQHLDKRLSARLHVQ